MSLGWRLRTALGGLTSGARAAVRPETSKEGAVLSYAPTFDLRDADSYSALLEQPAESSIPADQRGHLIDWYWQSHPRFQFFKSLPQSARLLDVGAGSGGLAFWRGYLPPVRSDLSMFAVDMKQGEYFDQYQGFQVCNLDTEPISFDDEAFEGVLASHVLEHVQDPAGLVRQFANKLRRGGVCYLEVPSWHTKELPKREAFADLGWPMTISNFFDDCTHRETFQLPELVGLGEAAGMALVRSGFVTHPYLADRMVSFGLQHQDAEMMLYGYWARTSWAQYAAFEKR
jgi:SAM-dependent methyltransferase